MITSTLQALLEQMLLTYDQFRSSVEVAIARACAQPTPQSCRDTYDQQSRIALDWFANEASRHITSASVTIQRELASVAREAQSNGLDGVDSTSALGAIQIDMARALSQRIRSLVEQDVESGRRSIGFLVAQAARQANSRQTSIQVGFQMAKENRRIGVIEDALGRRVSTRRHIGLSSTSAWTKAWNLSIFYLLMSAGEELAQISRPGHQDDGLIIDIETYPELEDRLFHPNSWALLTPVFGSPNLQTDQ